MQCASKLVDWVITESDSNSWMEEELVMGCDVTRKAG